MSRHIVTDGQTREAQSERLYCVTDKKGNESFAWSPDGEGFFWYDTYEEAEEQHGTQRIHYVDDITDF